MSAAIEHIPTDMTVTVGGSMSLPALQAELAKGGQWLPVDPPSPENVTVASLLAHNLNGPRRFGYGTIRDYVIGMKVVLADGRTIKSGGKVVKNVAGYDLLKLFIGARNSLGMIVEATFKLRPLPEAEQFAQKDCATLKEAGELVDAILLSPITPTVLDLHRVNTKSFSVIAGFDGAREDVEWQMAEARKLGLATMAAADYEKSFWTKAPETIRATSVLPSRLIETIAASGCGEFVARAGNGIFYHRGGPPSPRTNPPAHLWERAKAAFDPKGILAPLPS